MNDIREKIYYDLFKMPTHVSMPSLYADINLQKLLDYDKEWEVHRKLELLYKSKNPNIKENNVNDIADSIDEVIYNYPATIVRWRDGTKTVVKCNEGDVYSREAGLMACIIKKMCGNKGNYNNLFREFCC